MGEHYNAFKKKVFEEASLELQSQLEMLLQDFSHGTITEKEFDKKSEELIVERALQKYRETVQLSHDIPLVLEATKEILRNYCDHTEYCCSMLDSYRQNPHVAAQDYELMVRYLDDAKRDFPLWQEGSDIGMAFKEAASRGMDEETLYAAFSVTLERLSAIQRRLVLPDYREDVRKDIDILAKAFLDEYRKDRGPDICH